MKDFTLNSPVRVNMETLRERDISLSGGDMDWLRKQLASTGRMIIEEVDSTRGVRLIHESEAGQKSFYGVWIDLSVASHVLTPA